MTDPIVITPRAAPLSTTSASGGAEGQITPATDQSSLDNTQRNWLITAAAVVGLVALYWVFFVLPGSMNPTVSRVSEDTPAASLTNSTETAASSAAAVRSGDSTPQVISPFKDIQLARAKEQAEKELAAFVELQIELEDKLQIGAWGQSRYDAVKDLATRGDTEFQAREFTKANTTYAAATLGLEELRASGEAEFSASMQAGQAALTDFNQLLAQREFGRALTIKPTSPEALTALERCRQLPEVQTLLRKARQLARRGDTQAATATYQEILAIDPLTATIPEAMEELASAATRADYQDHLSRGFAALESGRHTTASKAFKAALGIRPKDSVALGGLQQIALEMEVLSLQKLRSAATKAVTEERWKDALIAYDRALENDPNLAFAQSGRRAAAERARMHQGMTLIINQAEKLSDNARMQEAIKLLAGAAALPSAGPIWAVNLAQAQATVTSYQSPVAVRLTSDNSTLVTVYKVGRIGTFATHDLELRPGAYTIVGSADGYQDVRKEIVVKPQMQPVEIRCENRL